MVATAHGTDIHMLLKNPDLSLLVGGVSPDTLGDDQAKFSSILSKATVIVAFFCLLLRNKSL